LCALQAAQQQLRRIELLVKIQQYDTARLQLREGSFQTLRMDLGYGQEMYRVVSPTVSVLHANWLLPRRHNRQFIWVLVT
jgi:hypothetical protein